jgi:NAD(P)-dependent dehydrogenase (short-subunit alcohol dehydrogenase family)
VAADFTGKTALITGAGRGIGRAIALGLAGAGAGVVLLARTAGQLEETRDLLRGQGVPAGRISVVPADLADEEDRGRAVAAVLAAWPSRSTSSRRPHSAPQSCPACWTPAGAAS